ncbi:transposase [Priestia megaterium]|uniref:transposase n=1 Tax=Priestia megaterium TaxID=1404 RepID=UPI002E1FA2A9
MRQRFWISCGFSKSVTRIVSSSWCWITPEFIMPKWSREFLREEGQCFHFIYLPPYSPQLNPIERLWKWLKDTVIANVFHKDRNDIIQAITRFVNYIHERPEEVLQRLGCAV